MRTIQVQIFPFAELSASAKQTAKDNYASLFGYVSESEAFASLEALAKHFGGRLKQYQIDYFHATPSYASFDMGHLHPAEIAELLAQLGTYNPDTLKGNGDCKLTGYCADENAIDGFRAKFASGETSLDTLMECAFRYWLKACQEDCADFYSDTQFAEHCEANGYEFTERGELTK